MIWGFHPVIVEEHGVLGCCTVWLGNLFPAFWRNLLPSCSGL